MFFSPDPIPKPERPVERVAIISWNIHEGAGDVEEVIRRLRHGEFTAGERIDEFVLLLQEAVRRDSSVPPHL